MTEKKKIELANKAVDQFEKHYKHLERSVVKDAMRTAYVEGYIANEQSRQAAVSG